MDPAVTSELCRQSALAMGRTWPNPSVGCVIESPGGRFCGGTEVPGGRHAEIVALDAFDEARRAADSPLFAAPATLHVTLEPCSRHGRTAPCTERIVKYSNLSVEFLAYDPSLQGEGQRDLRNAGINVVYRESPLAQAFLGGFLNRAKGLGPRLHLKLAHSGPVAGKRGSRLMISGPDGLALGQLLRSRFDAVLTGPGTAAADRPRLDLRAFGAPRFQRTFGEDLLLDSLLSLAGEITEQSGSFESSGKNPFQPARLFILKEKFEGCDAWLSEQESISVRTGREYVILSEKPHLWPGAVEIPSMRQPGFCQALRKVLAGLGYNEVLLECGPGLYSAVGPELSVTDRLYFIESKGSLTGDVLFAPETFEAFPAGKEVRAVYESESDILRVIA